MLEYIGAAWRAALDEAFPATDRIYINFRNLIYPPDDGNNLDYTLITSGDNQPGSFNLTDGYTDYLIDLPDTLSIGVRIKPTFSYNTSDNQPIWAWWIDENHRLMLYYDATSDKYTLSWKDGGTERSLVSDAYSADEDLQVWTDIYCIIDLTTGDTTGSALYVDRTEKDTAWSGNIDVKVSNFPKLSIRHGYI